MVILRKYTYDYVKKFVESNSGCELVSKEYRSCTEKLTFRCACGQEFDTDLHHFMRQNQRQCPSCGRVKAAGTRRLSLEEINSRLAELGCVYISGEYKNRKSDITIRCACGHERTSRLNSILADSFSGLCVECSDTQFRGRNRLTIEQVRASCAELRLELLSQEYKRIKDPLEFRCSCGRTFITTWEIVSYYNKTRCDYCTHKKSFGEQSVENWLSEHGVRFVSQEKFPGCGGRKRSYKFDFYLPELNTCIEYDGQQHFKEVDFAGTGDTDALRAELFDTQCRDLVKDIYCEDHGIDLIRIRFDELDKLDEILSDKLIPR